VGLIVREAAQRLGRLRCVGSGGTYAAERVVDAALRRRRSLSRRSGTSAGARGHGGASGGSFESAKSGKRVGVSKSVVCEAKCVGAGVVSCVNSGSASSTLGARVRWRGCSSARRHGGASVGRFESAKSGKRVGVSKSVVCEAKCVGAGVVSCVNSGGASSTPGPSRASAWGSPSRSCARPSESARAS